MKPGRISLSLLLLALLVSCSCSRSAPIPNDQDLIDRLLAQESSFAALLSYPTDQELLARLGVLSLRASGNGASARTFVVWEKDLPGPGGYAKGYYYSTDRPALIVDSIDEIYSSRPADQVEVFRHIKGPWYLYYSSSN
jgi:hypothetical protein